jgi:hypothetical protein
MEPFRIDLLQPGPTAELDLDPTLGSKASSLSRLVGPCRTAQYKEEVGSWARVTRFTGAARNPTVLTLDRS